MESVKCSWKKIIYHRPIAGLCISQPVMWWRTPESRQCCHLHSSCKNFCLYEPSWKELPALVWQIKTFGHYNISKTYAVQHIFFPFWTAQRFNMVDKSHIPVAPKFTYKMGWLEREISDKGNMLGYTSSEYFCSSHFSKSSYTEQTSHYVIQPILYWTKLIFQSLLSSWYSFWGISWGGLFCCELTKKESSSLRNFFVFINFLLLYSSHLYESFLEFWRMPKYWSSVGFVEA